MLRQKEKKSCRARQETSEGGRVKAEEVADRKSRNCRFFWCSRFYYIDFLAS